MQGKKQVDIRESNKDAVINILLENEMSLMEMASKLNLSHTALIKVTKELLEQKLIYKKDTLVLNFGRPSAIYDINPNSAVAAAILISSSEVEIYFVDMKGFQINNITIKNDFADIDLLHRFLSEQVAKLTAHPRLKNQRIHFLYVGLPAQGLYGKDYNALSAFVKSKANEILPQTECRTARDIDLIQAGESKYGVLNSFNGNAIILKVDKDLMASIMVRGKVYCGDNACQGQFLPDTKTFTFAALKQKTGIAHSGDIAQQYVRGDKKTVQTVSAAFVPFAESLSGIIKFLDINKLILCGNIVDFGTKFLDYANGVLRKYNQKLNCEYVVLGKNAFRAGAVWLATYNTLKEIVLRKV